MGIAARGHVAHDCAATCQTVPGTQLRPLPQPPIPRGGTSHARALQQPARHSYRQHMRLFVGAASLLPETRLLGFHFCFHFAKGSNAGSKVQEFHLTNVRPFPCVPAECAFVLMPLMSAVATKRTQRRSASQRSGAMGHGASRPRACACGDVFIGHPHTSRSKKPRFAAGDYRSPTSRGLTGARSDWLMCRVANGRAERLAGIRSD
ncbi:unnamed protein product [Lampetra fluviatilis]